MTQRRFSLLLEESLQRLDQGEDLPDLLADFPDQAQQLKPLLLVAMASRTFPLPTPSQTAQHFGRNQMLTTINQLERRKALRKKDTIPAFSRVMGRLASVVRAGGFTRLAYSYRLASVFLVLILSAGFFTLNASASSQPGDFLYALKLRMEQAGLVPSHVEKETSPLPPEPWKFGQVVWTLEGIPDFLEDQSQAPDMTGVGDRDLEKDLREAERDAAKDLKEAEKEEAAAAREEAQDLKEVEKEIAAADREAEKEAAEAEKEAEKDESEAEKEEEQVLKDEEQEAAEDEKEAEKDQKEAEKVIAQDEKEAEKDAKQADKDAAKIEKDNSKDNKKNK